MKERRVFMFMCLLLAVVVGSWGIGQGPAPAQAATPPQATMQKTLPDGTTVDPQNSIRRKMTIADRKAARARQGKQKIGVNKNFAGIDPRTAKYSPLAVGPKKLAKMSAGANGLSAATLGASMTPGALPDYFGVANWANSPLPTLSSGPAPPPVFIGNPLIARSIATDGAGTILGVHTIAALPGGTLVSFQTYDQPGSGPNTFRGYVLRPAGGASQYTVVFDSGPLSVPSVAAGQIQTWAVAPFAVLAGDVIASYGAGIPFDNGGVADTVYYPVNTAPAVGQTITLGAGGYPLYPVVRTYSFGANVQTGPPPPLVVTGGMRKFVDTLPNINTANNLGQQLPLAVPPLTSIFPDGSDYYEIALVEYHEQMHSDLPGPHNPATPGALGTKLRGYVQTNGPLGLSQPPQYLGPLIIAKGCDPAVLPACVPKPVRIKFTNMLPPGAAGNLFIPTDITYMGAGNGPDGTPYAQNRGTLHLHGGNTPWISDGTPHQWTVPALQATNYPKGVSTAYVPDMWFDTTGAMIASCAGHLTCAVAGASNNPGPGSMTFYYTNQQSGRLMFYHDHAYGITRLNVYVGEAAGFLVADPAEEIALKAATVPGTIPDPTNLATADVAHIIPLIIQDKTFVPDDGVAGGQLAATDPTWDLTAWGGKGNLWFTHVYMPNQNPADLTGTNAFGRWDYGPWFWPPQDPETFVPSGQPYPCTSIAYGPTNPPDFPPLMCPGTPLPSGTPESFMDTPLVNGTAYPKLTVDPAAYRLQILSAGNDRSLNLQLYVAEPLSVAVTNGGTGYTAAPTVAFVGGAGGPATAIATISNVIAAINIVNGGSGYAVPPAAPPAVTITDLSGSGAVATATVNASGVVTAITVTSGGLGYAAPTVAIDPPPAGVTATATAAVTGTVTDVTVTSYGATPWTVAPTVAFTAGGGAGASAITSINTEVRMVPAVPRTVGTPLPLCATPQPITSPNLGTGLATAILNASGALLTPTGMPPACWPTSWPTDGRDGGVPDPLMAGPPFVQMATEGGLLPKPVVIPSTPMGYEYNRRSITVLNGGIHGLWLGPAERADVVVDFTAFAGKTLILYNDAPTPVPAFDPRFDYYTGDPDQTSSGGAPSTMPGYGPNTRTIMQIKVNATGTPNVPPFNLATLQTALPPLFKTTQDVPIVPEKAYGGPVNNYLRIQDNSISFFNSSPVGGLTLLSGGSGYTSAPTVAFTGGGGAGATATANLATRSVATLNLTNGGANYITAPTVTITGGGGAGATATAVLAPKGVASIAVTSAGSNYTSTPTVTITGGGGAGATATATRNTTTLRITGVTVINPGSGYTTAPTVAFTGGGGSGAAATATLTRVAVASLNRTAGGSGYTSAPTVTITGGSGSGATATATLTTAAVASLTLTSGGAGYTSAPAVTITGGGGAGASALAVGPTAALLPKTIQELFTLDYGRMNATLGVELPFTNFLTQTTIPYGYIDPPTEIFKPGETQYWKVTHNGVDTHFIHFHLFNVQVINRVGWDGAIKPPDPNELSWKDTVRMNPLEDVVVTFRAATPNLPWQLPNSNRFMDVTQVAGSSAQFTNVDPANQPAVVTNTSINFGWEYVWHCHILGHEENDMMRPMILAVPPIAPSTPSAALVNPSIGQPIRVTWTDNSLNETGFTIQRATAVGGPWTNVGTAPPGAGVGSIVTFVDTSPLARLTTYFYRVIANNVVGYTQAYAPPVVGYPHPSADAAPTAASNGVTTL